MKTIRRPSVLALVFAVGATGCDSAVHSAAVTRDAAVDGTPAGVADANGEGGAGASGVVWSASPAPVVGDGRLVDVGDANNGFGWDTCVASPPLTRSAPGAIPPASRGSVYLVSSSASDPDTDPASHLPQASFWPETPGTARGLWFDLALVGGSAMAATVTFYETNTACEIKREFGTFSVAEGPTLTGRWRTGCLDLGGKGTVEAIGIRIDAPLGVLGFDAIRFGKACD